MEYIEIYTIRTIFGNDQAAGKLILYIVKYRCVLSKKHPGYRCVRFLYTAIFSVRAVHSDIVSVLMCTWRYYKCIYIYIYKIAMYTLKNL